MFRTVSAMAGLAALAAAAFIGLGTLVQASAPAPVEKSDRADAVGCELRDWPYYRSGCIRDETRNAGRAVRARVVSTDRIELGHLNSVNPLAEHSPSPQLIQRANEISSAQRFKSASQQIAFEAAAGDATGSFRWPMEYRDLRTHLAAGDFIRRTVR